MATTWKKYSEAMALKIVPVGCHQPTLSYLREAIAKTLEKEIQEALTRQKEANFPDLEETRKGLAKKKQDLDNEDAAMKKKHKEREKDLWGKEQHLINREEILARNEASLGKIFTALDAYWEWLDGGGEADENGKRFQALWEAVKAYRKQRGR